MSNNARRLTPIDWDSQIAAKVGRAAPGSGGGMVSRALPFSPEEIEELRQAGDDYDYI